MSYLRGKYGVEYTIPVDKETHRLRWAFIGIVILATIAASSIVLRSCQSKPAVNPISVLTEPVPAENENEVLPLPKPKPAPTVSPAMQRSGMWLEASRTRSAAERTLLERLTTAEYHQNIPLAIDTIEKLRKSASMADLDDPLARRLGELNMKFLMSGERTPWTAEAKFRKNDTIVRLAREHGTTTAAVRKLNNIKDASRLETGQKIRVLEFPRAVFVVHKQLRYADLMLNGKFFKRYYVSISAKTKTGPYPITRSAGPRTRFNELGLRFTNDDLEEIEMFLAPGSQMSVANQ